MSRTYSIVCKETQLGVWIGQGWNGLETFYTGHPEIMARLHRFLAAHMGKELVVMDDQKAVCELDNYQEFENPTDIDDTTSAPAQRQVSIPDLRPKSSL